MSLNNRFAYQEPHEGQVSQFMRAATANGVVELGWIPNDAIILAIGSANMGAGTATFSWDGGAGGSGQSAATGTPAAGNYFPTQVRILATVASLPANQQGRVYVTYICRDPFEP